MSFILQRARRAAIRSVTAVATIGIGLEVTTHLPSQGRSSEFYHSLSDDLITPLMRRFVDPEVAHNIAIYMVGLGFSPQYRPSAVEQRVDMTTSNLFHGSNPDLKFSNPIGLAAGFDKDGEVIPGMILLGFGFVEIGTVTPQPQPGNPKPRMFRLKDDLGIINRYGFNSAGATTVAANLQYFRKEQRGEVSKKLSENCVLCQLYQMLPSAQRKRKQVQQGVVGVNIGKNKMTDDEHAIADYISNINLFAADADYLVLNISSPNTPGLRNWQKTDSLRALLKACVEARDKVAIENSSTTTTTTTTTTTPGVVIKKTPLLVKLAPDLTEDDLKAIAAVCMETSIDGIVISNTTNQRPENLISPNKHETGGLSGKPLRESSTECIRTLYKATEGKLPLIGVGGCFTGRDAYEKFKAGASLVQIYSSMVYEGPGVVSRMRQELANLMLENGQRNLQQDVVGLDHEEIFAKRRDERMEEQFEKVVVDEVFYEPIPIPDSNIIGVAMGHKRSTKTKKL